MKMKLKRPRFDTAEKIQTESQKVLKTVTQKHMAETLG
jgi:hypothetical protein